MNLKGRKGITLIALVITIVVLLILAGISISLVLGENGIIARAKEARTSQVDSDAGSDIQQAFAECYIDKEGDNTLITASDLQASIRAKGYSTATVTGPDANNQFTVTIGGATYKISTTGEMEVASNPGGGSGGPTGSTVDLKVGTTSLAGTTTAEALATYYGETVTGFKSVEEPTAPTNPTSAEAAEYSKQLELYNIDWQLFYDDATNVYLIASDYVRVNALPDELSKEANDSSDTPKYKAWFTTGGSNPNYTGPIMQNTGTANNPWPNGSESSVLKGASKNPLVSTYIKWIGSSLNTDGTNNTTDTRTNANLKAVAYMMDTEVWSDFKGSVTGSYAMGGPTLEMFIASYNATHDTDIATYSEIDSTNSNSNGYKVAWAAATPSWTNSISELLRSSDNMWVKTSNTKASGYWLASPSSNNADRVGRVSRGGDLGSIYVYNAYVGFRPVVSIPKSSIQTANS